MDIQIHLGPKPQNADDSGPQVIIGFTSEQFSQAVFLDVSQDPQEAVKVADALYHGYLKAAGEAVKTWKETTNDAPTD